MTTCFLIRDCNIVTKEGASKEPPGIVFGGM